jgi:hypothetical protein
MTAPMGRKADCFDNAPMGPESSQVSPVRRSERKDDIMTWTSDGVWVLIYSAGLRPVQVSPKDRSGRSVAGSNPAQGTDHARVGQRTDSAAAQVHHGCCRGRWAPQP